MTMKAEFVDLVSSVVLSDGFTEEELHEAVGRMGGSAIGTPWAESLAQFKDYFLANKAPINNHAPLYDELSAKVWRAIRSMPFSDQTSVNLTTLGPLVYPDYNPNRHNRPLSAVLRSAGWEQYRALGRHYWGPAST